MMNELRKLMEASVTRKIKSIKVDRVDPTEELTVDNPTDLTLIGIGKKSVTFHLDETRIVKIYAKEGRAEEEYNLLHKGAVYGITPKVYLFGPTFLVLESLKTPNLLSYMEMNGLSQEFTSRLLRLLSVSKELGWGSGHAPEDIYVMPDGTLKVVNISDKAVSADYPPKKLLKGLGTWTGVFLQHLEVLNPELHQQWINHPESQKYVTKTSL
ncbi:hypothetical protein [Paenibacillus qinlingensis]|nr:hypothetical protein [Paenibacillus qinlingensis]